MPTYKPITLKMSTAPAYGYTSIKQMDVEGVELILTLKNTDDSDYNLTSGSTLFFKMANESGNVKVTLSEMDSPSNITRDGANVVRVLLTESMVSETGIMACELQEMHSGTFTSSQLFYLRVWPTTADGEIIDSHEYKSLVSAYLAIDNALSVATLAKNYSESTITEENARQAAELLRIQAENDRVLAESARVAAENLRGIEVANARGDHATLGDRLDEMDVGIEGNASDLENTKLKVIRLEQEVKRYKELYEQSNPTQSPRVSSVGYGVVSLPKNAAQGPLKVKVEGQTQYVQGGGVRNTSGTFRVRAIGKNLFDGKMEIGAITWNTGINVPSTSNIRTKNYIKVKENTSYILTTNSGAKDFDIFFYDELKNRISSLNKASVTPFTTPAGTKYVRFMHKNINVLTYYYQLEEGGTATAYEPYTESNMYLIAKDEQGNIAELRSLPNGTKDEIRMSGGKAELVKRIGKTSLKGNEPWGEIITNEDNYRATLVNFVNNNNVKLTTGNFSKGAVVKNELGEFNQVPFGIDNAAYQIQFNRNYNLYLTLPKSVVDTMVGTTILDKFKAYLNQYPVTLIYQLAEPVEMPIEVSGSLVSHPNGTVFIEPIVADAGVYTDKMEVLHQDLPIKAIEKVSKVDFVTGLETELDIDGIVIAEDKLSFTHPDLTSGDIVFFVYEYDRESTVGETEIEYYDSRYVIKDSVTGKFYKWHIAVAEGVPSIELVEV